MKKVTFLLALASIVGTAQAGVLDAVGQFYIKQAGLDRLTAVIPPASENKVSIDGRAMLVSGSSTCPREPLPDSTAIWIMGESDDSYVDLHAGHDRCVVIGPHTSSVSVVLWGNADGRVERLAETWAVQHGLPGHADALVLKRPNGEFVTVAR